MRNTPCAIDDANGETAQATATASIASPTRQVYMEGYQKSTRESNAQVRTFVIDELQRVMQQHGITPRRFFADGVSLQLPCNVYNLHWCAVHRVRKFQDLDFGLEISEI